MTDIGSFAASLRSLAQRRRGRPNKGIAPHNDPFEMVEGEKEVVGGRLVQARRLAVDLTRDYAISIEEADHLATTRCARA